MVVALCFNVRIRHQEHGKYNDNNVPTRENQSDKVCLVSSVHGERSDHVRERLARSSIYSRRTPRGERYHGRDLEKTDLQCVGRANLHAQRDVPTHGKSHGVHELGCVRDEGEQCDTQELFVNPRPFKDDVDHFDQELCKISCKKACMADQNMSTAHRR